MGLFLMGIAVYAPPFQKLLGTVSLSLLEVGFVFGAVISQVFLIECVKWGFRAHGIFHFGRRRYG